MVKAIVREFSARRQNSSTSVAAPTAAVRVLKRRSGSRRTRGIVAGSTTLDVVATNTVWHAWNARVNSSDDNMPILTAEKIPALAQAVARLARA